MTLQREFVVTTDINAPAERVWQVMSDTDRWHEWTPSITSIKRIGHKPFETGSRVVIRQPKFPPALWKITTVEVGRSFTWVNVAPGLRVVAHHRIEPMAAASRAVLSITYAGIFGGVLARLTKDITQRYIDLEASGLKARSEDPAYRYTKRRDAPE
jgi:hypothetical protein